MIAITVSAGAGVKNWDTQNVQMGIFGAEICVPTEISDWELGLKKGHSVPIFEMATRDQNGVKVKQLQSQLAPELGLKTGTLKMSKSPNGHI